MVVRQLITSAVFPYMFANVPYVVIAYHPNRMSKKVPIFMNPDKTRSLLVLVPEIFVIKSKYLEPQHKPNPQMVQPIDIN